jgi:hypothetical protein
MDYILILNPEKELIGDRKRETCAFYKSHALSKFFTLNSFYEIQKTVFAKGRFKAFTPMLITIKN